MVELRHKQTGVIVEVSDEAAEKLTLDYEPSSVPAKRRASKPINEN